MSQASQASDPTADAAALLWNLWQSGEVIDSLPPASRPTTRQEGYAIQALVETRSARPLFGWKIAATSAAGQKHIGVSGPLSGRLLAERAFPDGTTLIFGHNRMRVAEPEFAFRFGDDIRPREAPYAVDEVLARVDTLHPAIEIPDSRFADFVHAGEAQLIADNACAHEFVLGDAAPESWRAIDLAAHPVRAMIAGRITRDGSGRNVLGDPREALTWLVNEATALGQTLKADQVVTTGTCMVPLPILPGDAVTADFGPIGRVSARFARS